MVHQKENEYKTVLLFFTQPSSFPIYFDKFRLMTLTKTNYMKPVILCLLIVAGSIVACKNNKSNTMTIASKDGKSKVSVDVNSAAAVGDDMQKKMEELKKLTPLTTDQLKMMLPEQLMGMKRSSFNANSMMGFASAEAKPIILLALKLERFIPISCSGSIIFS